ncbi:hypothetical protein F8M41_020789 [Gigaspora margarita]|uniref:Uncharacterized protein n=1 Tax=Gigaspora margarita TaxID=4874 RepID=A0A8H3WRC2_GIGMA|nr:hypothetical protein F8M41_020789 [Gigaspora margarita]
MILKWKRSEKTKACYWRLFDEVEDSGVTYIVKMLTKIWPSGDSSEENVVYPIAVAQVMLNPKYKKIMMSDTAIKHKIAKNLAKSGNLQRRAGRSGRIARSLKEAKQEPKNNDSNNDKKIYKRSRVETSKIEWDDQDDLSDDLKEAKNEPENNDSRASGSLSSDDNNDSKKKQMMI